MWLDIKLVFFVPLNVKNFNFSLAFTNHPHRILFLFLFFCTFNAMMPRNVIKKEVCFHHHSTINFCSSFNIEWMNEKRERERERERENKFCRKKPYCPCVIFIIIIMKIMNYDEWMEWMKEWLFCFVLLFFCFVYESYK